MPPAPKALGMPAKLIDAQGRIPIIFTVGFIIFFIFLGLVLLCHFSPATPHRGDGSGRSKTAADRRSAVGGPSGCDCRSAGACRPRGRGAGLLHRPAAAR